MTPDERTLPGQVDDAIESIADLERRALDEASLHQRAVERLTLAIGRPRTLYLVLGIVTAWVGLNLALGFAGKRPLDPPPFSWLQGAISLSALLMTVVILTTENRISEFEEQRARLNLQISMLAERKSAKTIALLEELRYDMPEVPNREDPEAAEMTLPTDPHEVSDQLAKRTPNRGELPGA